MNATIKGIKHNTQVFCFFYSHDLFIDCLSAASAFHDHECVYLCIMPLLFVLVCLHVIFILYTGQYFIVWCLYNMCRWCIDGLSALIICVYH